MQMKKPKKIVKTLFIGKNNVLNILEFTKIIRERYPEKTTRGGNSVIVMTGYIDIFNIGE